MSDNPTPAGKGEHHIYRILSPGSDQEPLAKGKHYLGIDAVAWYINKESNWFSNSMASGTLEIQLKDGSEKYQAALGTFALKGGAHFAPVFENPVLPDRNYLGGRISLSAQLTAVRKDTLLASLLKSATDASLGIVSGMVQTASLVGPAAILGAAGGNLVDGVKQLLSSSAYNSEPLFDFGNLQESLRGEEVVGPEMYVLFHRGASLDQEELSVQAEGQLRVPYIGAELLTDGAWLLLRVRRSTKYGGVRDWYLMERALRNKLTALVSDYQDEQVTKEEALLRLKMSSTGDQTLFDEFAKLRALIQNDGVLTETEAADHVATLRAAIKAARDAIAKGEPADFKLSMRELNRSKRQGQAPVTPVGKAFAAETRAFLAMRRALVARAEKSVRNK